MNLDAFRSARAATAIIGCIVLMCVGCGPGRPPAYKTTGKVVFTNGTPVKTGTVELKSREHTVQARGTIGEDGRFVLTTYTEDDGAVAGTHDCVVVQMVMVEDLKQRNHGTYGVVNPRFASYHTAALNCTIEPKPGNEITLTVEGVGKLSAGGTEKDHKVPKVIGPNNP